MVLLMKSCCFVQHHNGQHKDVVDLTLFTMTSFERHVAKMLAASFEMFSHCQSLPICVLVPQDAMFISFSGILHPVKTSLQENIILDQVGTDPTRNITSNSSLNVYGPSRLGNRLYIYFDAGPGRLGNWLFGYAFFFFFLIFVGPRPSLWSHQLLLFWTSCVLPHGFQSQSRSGSLACTLYCLRAVIPKVTSGATPAFSTNRGVHCVSVYVAR